MRRNDSGFTVIEVLVAIVVLGTGIIALAGSSGLVTRMIGRGRVETRAAQIASRRLETLRFVAGSTSPQCTAAAFASGGPVTAQAITESWQVSPAGAVRLVTVEVSYPTPGRVHTDTLETRIEC